MSLLPNCCCYKKTFFHSLCPQENFDQPIFECLNPKGEIPPGRAVSIEWRFFPLEAKTYMVDIPIKVHNGDTAIVTFSGIGYDQRIMGDTMPFSDQLEVSGVPAVQTAEIPGQVRLILRREADSRGREGLWQNLSGGNM